MLEKIKNLKKTIYRGEIYETNINAIKSCCVVFSIVMFIFFAINLFQNTKYTALASLFMCILFATVALITHITHKRLAPVLVLTITTVVACTIYTIQGTSEGFAILWTSVLPLAIMYFLDVRIGIVVSFYFELLFIILFCTPINTYLDMKYSQLFMNRYPLLYIIILLIDSMAMIQYHNSTLERLEYDEQLQNVKKLHDDTLKARNREIAAMSVEMVRTLANTIDAKDTYTNQHSNRVSEYSVMLAKELGWSEDRINQLQYDSLVHDIGKIGIPDGILNKSGKLSDDEFDTIKSHTVTGMEILNNVTALTSAQAVARNHHERFDGTGYPDHKKGKEIPANARVVCIADAFDAMVSDRVYRKALPIEKVREELIENAGTQFDPDYVRVFVSLIDKGVIPFKD